MKPPQFRQHIAELLGDALINSVVQHGELTVEIARPQWLDACTKLRDDPQCRFDSLMDLCAVDYAHWQSQSAHAGESGVVAANDSNRANNANAANNSNTAAPTARFAVVCHLLSLAHNRRLRLRVWLDDDAPALDSLTDVWPAADWYEREAFDLFGVMFDGHPDLRRLLTDYGFIGHPFRKDFPLSGEVEVRYDEQQGRVIYQPVTIEPRVLVPRTIGKPPGGESNGSESNGCESNV